MDENLSELCNGDIGGEKSAFGWLRGLLAIVNMPIIFRDIRFFKFHKINVKPEPFFKKIEHPFTWLAPFVPFKMQ